MKIVFCGFSRAGLECLTQLLNNYDIMPTDILVFTHDLPGNNEFIKFVNHNNIRLSYENINNCPVLMDEFKSGYLLSIYYRHIISVDILKHFDNKAMNLHPSLLPAYRGTKSSVWAILNNETYTGISFHHIRAGIDTGEIILQKRIRIMDEDTAYSLYHKLISLFSSNFCNAFDSLMAGFVGFEQVGLSSYFPRKLPFGGELEIKTLSKDDALRFVRAMHFPPHKGAVFILEDGSKIEVSSVAELNRYMDL